MRRETLFYFLFVVVTSSVLLSLPFFTRSVSAAYLMLVLIAIGIIWFIARILYYRRLREQQAQD